MGDEKFDLLIDNACKVAEEFVKIFYEACGQKRHNLNRFYMENATLSFDGNSVSGKENIQKYLEALPATIYVLTSLDAQPVSIDAVKGQQTVLIQAAGNVKFAKGQPIGFSESFVITAHENKWKIFSDTFRLQRPIGIANKT